MKFRKRLRFTILLIIVMLFCIISISAAEPTFRFSMSVDGKAEKRAEPGDIITVVFTLERTDSSEPYSMYAMQNEIRYDSTFFELVEDSLIIKEGIVANDTRINDSERELYMNFLSLSGGVRWNSKTNVGSFQLRVIGKEGASVIRCCDCSVSRPDGSGSYSFETSDVTVVVSELCTVSFDGCGGSAVPEQTVVLNGKAALPTIPVREGYVFRGWFTDAECTEKWSFSEPITQNLLLYAGWDAVNTEQAAPFADVAEDDWYYDSIRYVYQNGMMNGVGDAEFAPDTETSRAMTVTILWRMEGCPTVNVPMTFADVEDHAWYTEAVRWASSAGIVNGYSETRFGTNDTITREQMAAILSRYASYKGLDTSSETEIAVFQDHANVSDWAGEAMQWSVGCGLIQGIGDGTLYPQGSATRAQTATILMRFCIWM